MNYYELSSIELNRLKKKKIKNWLYYEWKLVLLNSDLIEIEITSNNKLSVFIISVLYVRVPSCNSKGLK